MRLYTITLLDDFNGGFIDSVSFQTPFPIDLDMVDYEGLLASLGLNFDLSLVEAIVTDGGPINMVPVVEF